MVGFSTTVYTVRYHKNMPLQIWADPCCVEIGDDENEMIKCACPACWLTLLLVRICYVHASCTHDTYHHWMIVVTIMHHNDYNVCPGIVVSLHFIVPDKIFHHHSSIAS